MLQKHTTVLGMAIGLLAITASPALANYLSSAIATADCKGYSITITAAELGVNAPYRIAYSLTINCGGTTQTVSGYLDFTPSDTTATWGPADPGTFGTWNNGPTGNCSVTGIATLTPLDPPGQPPESTIPIVINGSNTATLSCPVCTGSIGDYVWNDLNSNGLQDSNEQGLNGVEVQLLGSVGNFLTKTVTADAPAGYTSPGPNPHGYYQFTDLCQGNYQVVVNPNQPALNGLMPTTSLVGLNPAIDSNGSPAMVNLPKDSSVETIDFGYRANTTPLTLTCAAGSGQEGVAYSSMLVANGGVPAYTFSISSGSLPLGLTLNSSTGAISGTPKSFGTSNYTAKVVDHTGSSAGTAVKNCSITIPPACTIPGVTISNTSWNSFNIPGGTSPVVWVHAHIGKPSGVPTGTKSSVLFTGASITLNSTVYPLPNGLLTFDPAASSIPTTTFNAALNRWETVLNPGNLSDEIFFLGGAIPVTSSIAGGAKATLTFTAQTDDRSLSFPWQWSAAVYTFWPTDWNQAQILPYHKSDHAGTPENTAVQRSLIQGPRGGGGSNFTGSWSATGNGSCPAK